MEVPSHCAHVAGVATIPRESPGRSPTRATVVHRRFHSLCIIVPLLLPARRAGEPEPTSDTFIQSPGDPLDRFRHATCPLVRYLPGEPRTAPAATTQFCLWPY